MWTGKSLRVESGALEQWSMELEYLIKDTQWRGFLKDCRLSTRVGLGSEKVTYSDIEENITLKFVGASLWQRVDKSEDWTPWQLLR